jgi:hypothetical protein
VSGYTDPAWSRISENTTTTINGRQRAVIDHYGTITQIPFPGVRSTEGGALPTFDVDVSRTDVVDDDDQTVVYPGPYLLTVSPSEQCADSTLTSVEDLEHFGAAILTAAQQVRKFLANEALKEVL